MINAHYNHKIYVKKIRITVEYKTSIKRIQILITYVFLNKGGLLFLTRFREPPIPPNPTLILAWTNKRDVFRGKKYFPLPPVLINPPLSLLPSPPPPPIGSRARCETIRAQILFASTRWVQFSIGPDQNNSDPITLNRARFLWDPTWDRSDPI